MIDSHASLQGLHSCKLNTVAWVVELTYLHVIVERESLLGGHGKARCTVIRSVDALYPDETTRKTKKMIFLSMKYCFTVIPGQKLSKEDETGSLS